MGIFLLYILCTVCAGIYIVLLFQNGVEVKRVEKDDKVASTHTEKIEITEEQIYRGSLLLVNKDYPVKQDSIKSYIINLFQNKELVRGYGVLDRNLRHCE